MANLLQQARTPYGRAFLMFALMAVCFGMAMSTQETIVTNYFENILGLEGPQFGYITAIREIPGFLLIFLTAMFYRLSLQRLTSMMLVALAIGYVLFGASNSFLTVIPWVILSSMGYHTVLQTQYALGLSLTTEARSGRILGITGAMSSAGAMLAMGLVYVVFRYDLFSYRETFIIAGGLALAAAVAIFNFPTLRDGVKQDVVPERQKFVLKHSYRFYYYLSVLDGARQQIFFSFGLWVLVHQFDLGVEKIALLLIVVRGIAIFTSPWIGRMIDVHGERQMLAFVNVGYLVALMGYAFAQNLYLAAACYVIYAFIMPMSSIGSATYLRKVALSNDIAPSLAMGVTLQHMAAIVVPISTGYILNFVGYQVPFMIACGFAIATFFVTQKLNPSEQKSAERIAEDQERAREEGQLVVGG